jgi:hypothetical protein
MDDAHSGCEGERNYSCELCGSLNILLRVVLVFVNGDMIE